jgi:molybdopterin converting factor small subunit
MKVKVKFFAALRDLAGLKEADIELPDGSTVTDLLQELTNRFGEPFKKYVFDEKTGKPRGVPTVPTGWKKHIEYGWVYH